MSTSDIRTVGWIGLGKMGLPICRRLTAAGIAVTCLPATTRARQRPRRGHATTRDLAELARADMIISAVPDDAALTGIISDTLVGALRPGQIVIDTSTVSPTASPKWPRGSRRAGRSIFARRSRARPRTPPADS